MVYYSRTVLRNPYLPALHRTVGVLWPLIRLNKLSANSHGSLLESSLILAWKTSHPDRLTLADSGTALPEPALVV